MARKFKGVLIAIAAVAVLAVGGTAIAGAAGAGDNEKPITGAALDKASAAALQHTGGGEVSDTEVGDEEGYYEVEVTRSDGSQVDVHLDQGFNVLSQVGDKDGANEK
jgi:uncharacterized protein with LGFP repeats